MLKKKLQLHEKWEKVAYLKDREKRIACQKENVKRNTQKQTKMTKKNKRDQASYFTLEIAFKRILVAVITKSVRAYHKREKKRIEKRKY